MSCRSDARNGCPSLYLCEIIPGIEFLDRQHVASAIQRLPYAYHPVIKALNKFPQLDLISSKGLGNGQRQDRAFN